MKNVHIQDRCEFCDGEAYVFAGEAVNANGNFYSRYLPCGYCQGKGEQVEWIGLQQFLDLLEREARKDPMAPDWLGLARRKPMTQYRDRCESAGI